VAVACLDPRVRAALAAHPLGGHLIVTESVFCAVSAVLATPTPAVERLRLAPHPTAERAAREFVTRTLVDWGLDRLVLSADFVVSELVSSSTMQATTGIDVSVAWNLGALRLTVVGRRSGWPCGCPQASQLVTMADPVSIRSGRSPSRHLRDDRRFGPFGRL
jgi:hypothetical protein